MTISVGMVSFRRNTVRNQGSNAISHYIAWEEIPKFDPVVKRQDDKGGVACGRTVDRRKYHVGSVRRNSKNPNFAASYPPSIL